MLAAVATNLNTIIALSHLFHRGHCKVWDIMVALPALNVGNVKAIVTQMMIVQMGSGAFGDQVRVH
jgi:hypothetical protein